MLSKLLHRHPHSSLVRGALLLAFGSVAACSADAGSNGATPDPSPPAADSGVGADAGHHAEAGSEAGSVAPPFVSNPPGAHVRDDTSPAQTALVLISSNLTQSPSGGMYYQQWFGEVFNAGAETMCYAEVLATFLDAGGATLTKYDSFADADAYQDPASTSTLPQPCIKPGAVGTFYSNAIVANAIAVSSVATIAVSFKSIATPGAVPHPHAPRVVAATPGVDLGPGYYALSGTLTNGPADISNVKVSVYPVGANSLVIDQLSAFHLPTYAANQSWAFKTNDVQAAFTKFHLYVDFIDMAAMRLPPAPPGSRGATTEARRAFVIDREANARTFAGTR